MSTRESLLTAIIFAYNHEDTIAKAIDSVLGQKTDYSYEIWLCEDCSTDKTLQICKKYAEQYPDRIKLFAQPVNTFKLPREQNHIYQAFNRVENKYFSYLDGDDYWCDEEKIQIALEVLENNPKYSTFAHDTLVKNHENGTEASLALTSGLKKSRIGNLITLEDLLKYRLYFHPSARIHRNVVDFSKTPEGLLADIFLLYAFLDKGQLCYCDKLMSVYNITGLGSWSKLTKIEQLKTESEVVYNTNLYFAYKYDAFFTRMVMKSKVLKLLKIILGIRLGWRVWHNLYLSKKV